MGRECESQSLKFGPAPVAYVSNEDDMIDPSMIQYRNRLYAV